MCESVADPQLVNLSLVDGTMVEWGVRYEYKWGPERGKGNP